MMCFLKKSSFVISVLCFACVMSSAVPPSKEEAIFIEQVENAYANNDVQGFFSKLFKYIKAFPQGRAIDRFLSMKGDIFYKNKKYAKAIKIYKKIQDRDIWQTIEFKYLSSYLALKDYESIVDYLYASQNITSESKKLILHTIEKILHDKDFHKELLRDYILYGIAIYESYAPNEHDLNSLQTLSQYYLEISDFQKAVQTLQKVLSLKPKNKEEILWRIANTQTKYDKKAALSTFSEISSMKGSHLPLASYNQLKLLLEEERFQDIIALKKDFLKNLNETNLPFLHFSLGVSYFANKEYTQSEQELTAFLKNIGDYQSYEEEVLDALISIAEIKGTNPAPLIEFQFLSFNIENESHEKVIKYVSDSKKLAKESKNLIFHTISKILKDEDFDENLVKEYVLCGIIIYESEEGHEYDLKSLKTLSQYYLMTEQITKAVITLKKIAYLDPKNKEKNLLSVANLQMKYDSNAAFSTFSEIIEMKGNLAPLAVHNQLKILFEENRFQEIIELKSTFLASLSNPSVPFFHYVLGKSYFANENYELSEIEFAAFLENMGSYQYHENEVKDVLAVIPRLKESLQQESTAELVVSEEEKAYFYKSARECKKNKEYDKAKHYLNRLLSVTDPKEKSTLHFELAVVNFESNNYLTSRKQFEEFLIDSPKSPLAALAWDYFIQSSVNLAKDDKYPFAKAQLIFDLEVLLERNISLMNKLEIHRYLFLLGQTQFAVRDYEGAIGTFLELIDQNPSQKILSEAYALLAYSYHYGLGDLEKYSAFIQKALELRPDLEIRNFSQHEVFSQKNELSRGDNL